MSTSWKFYYKKLCGRIQRKIFHFHIKTQIAITELHSRSSKFDDSTLAYRSNNKRVDIALTYIKGIGLDSSYRILKEVNVDGTKRAKDLTEDEVSRLASEIEHNFIVEGTLTRQVNSNISRLKDIACYRGLRHRRNLPVRGQRTRTNARTRKGPKRTMANKKKVIK